MIWFLVGLVLINYLLFRQMIDQDEGFDIMRTIGIVRRQIIDANCQPHPTQIK